MKNIFRFISSFKKQIMLIFILLIAQSYFELSIPNYTSDLINIGLQQGGIENSVFNSIRNETLEKLKLFMSTNDSKYLENSYGLSNTDGIRILKKDVDIKKLDEILQKPNALMFSLVNSKNSVDNKFKDSISKENNKNMLEMGFKKIQELPDNIQKQYSIKFVSLEYENQGLDLNKIRNNYLWKVGLKMIFMSIMMMTSAILVGLTASRLSAKMGKNIRYELYSKVMKFTNSEIEKFSSSSLITRATNDVQQIQMVVVIMLRMVFYAPILASGGIINLIGSNSGMDWIIISAVLILMSFISVLIIITMPRFKIIQKMIDNINLISREILTGIMPIRAFSRENHEEKRFDLANKDLYDTQLITNRTMILMNPVMMLVMNAVSVLIVWIGAKRIDLGYIQIGDLTAFISYSMVIIMSFLMMSMIFIMVPRAIVSANRIVEVLDTNIELIDSENPKDSLIKEVKTGIKFENVSFKYPGAEENILENINFVAEKGKTTAIIGSTGSGKSTLIKLIPRFYDVTEGSIKIDEIDIRDITQEKLRSMVGYVPQKGMLFTGSIEDNIKFDKKEITNEDMIWAAEIAQAKNFIEEKEDGYETKIAQEGSNVSGGQRQRLSIARALAKRADIFIFDDSFSALDFKTDLALRTKLHKELKDSTIIIVAQRISTILNAEQIIVLEDGKIVGKGTHKELSTCEIYREIAESQMTEEDLKIVEKKSMKGEKTNV